MTWSTHKCSVVLPPDKQENFFIKNIQLGQINEGKYLGFNIKWNEFSSTINNERIKKAQQIIGLLRKANITHDHMAPTVIRNICDTFVYAVAKYGIHLVKQTKDLEKRWNDLDKHVVKLITGIHLPRFDMKLQRITKTPSLQEHTGILLSSLEIRLKERKRRQPTSAVHEKVVDHFNTHRTIYNYLPTCARNNYTETGILALTNTREKYHQLERTQIYRPLVDYEDTISCKPSDGI